MGKIQQILLISEKQEDREFFESLTNALNIELVQVKHWEELVKLAGQSKNFFIAWDVDSEETLNREHPLFQGAVYRAISALGHLLKTNKLIAISSKTVNQCVQFSRSGDTPFLFHHNIIRRYDDKTFQVLQNILRYAESPELQGLASFFPKDTRIHKITLRKSDQKQAAADAVEHFLSKKGVDQRIAAKISQAADELLMNAIYDAARDPEGRPIRQLLDRKAKFSFNANERVDLEVAGDENFIAICASDYFGSLQEEVILPFLVQNYTDAEYKQKKFGPSAGLGLYGIVQSGVSLLMSSRPGARTDAIVFAPNTKSYRQFKASFQFFSLFFN